MNHNHSSIWFRTIVYLGATFIVFLVVIIALLWFVGGQRSASNVLLSDAERLATLEQQWIQKVESARNLGPGALNEFIAERTERAKSQRALTEQIRALERAPKNAKNQKDIRSGLEAGYASLKEFMPGPDPFTVELNGTKRKVVIAFLIVFAALAGVVAILFRMIVGPLETIVDNARRVSEGELNIKFHVKTDDELGQLSRVMDSLTTNFRELLTLIQSSCTTGLNLTQQLSTEEPAQDAERPKTLKQLEDVFLKMREITEYFRQG